MKVEKLTRIKHDVTNKLIRQKIILEMMFRELQSKGTCDSVLFKDLQSTLSQIGDDCLSLKDMYTVN